MSLLLNGLLINVWKVIMIKTVLNKSTVLSPCDEKTNIICPFTVKGEVIAVYIDFDYSPKNLDDFEKSKFLIKKCLSVDEPDITDDMINFNDFLPLKNLLTHYIFLIRKYVL